MDYMEDEKTIRGRFTYDGLDFGRGLLRYWISEGFADLRERNIWVPPMPTLMQEKIAVLNLSGKGVKVPKVGKKQSSLVYYLHFTEDEIKELESEHEQRNGSVGLEYSQQPSQAGASVPRS